MKAMRTLEHHHSPYKSTPLTAPCEGSGKHKQWIPVVWLPTMCKPRLGWKPSQRENSSFIALNIELQERAVTCLLNCDLGNDGFSAITHFLGCVDDVSACIPLAEDLQFLCDQFATIRTPRGCFCQPYENQHPNLNLRLFTNTRGFPAPLQTDISCFCKMKYLLEKETQRRGHDAPPSPKPCWHRPAPNRDDRGGIPSALSQSRLPP